MKKLLGSTLALALLFPYGQANAELLKNFKLGGQIDLQTQSSRNIVDFTTRQNSEGFAPSRNDRKGDAQTRVLLHMDWDLLDDVHAKVTLGKNDRSYGTVGGVNAHDIGGNGNSQPVSSPAGAGGTGVLETVAVDQAYFKIDKLADLLDASFGRMFYGEPGDMIIYFGPSDKALHGLPTTAIDAARFDWSNEHMNVSALVGKFTGNATTVSGATNVDLRGINASCTKMENLKLGAYLWNVVTHPTGALGSPPSDAGAAGGKNDFLYVVGLKAKATMGNAWLAGELAKNFGQNRQVGSTQVAPSRNYIGWAFKANAGAKLEIEGAATLTPWGEFAYGTGDQNTREAPNGAFQSVSPDYRPGTIYGRFSSNSAEPLGNGLSGVIAGNSLRNRVIMGFGLKANPSAVNKLTAALSYWSFRRQTLTHGADTIATGQGSRHIGSEADLDLTWAHSENVTLGLGWATFQPGGIIKNVIQAQAAGPSANSERGVNPATLAYMDVRVKF